MLSVEAAARYKLTQGPLAYGTAGFRARAERLDSTFFRMGMLASLRSRSRSGLAVGLMVTASHNAEPDNGIKLVDADGGMLHQSWEKHATALANSPPEDLATMLAQIVKDEGIPEDGCRGVVILGRDTRSHSARLAQISQEGIALLNAESVDAGLLTTPQLHHLVRRPTFPTPELHPTSSVWTTSAYAGRR